MMWDDVWRSSREIIQSNTGLSNWARADLEERRIKVFETPPSSSSSKEALRNADCRGIKYTLLFWDMYFDYFFIMLDMQIDLASFLHINLYKNRLASYFMKQSVLRHISCKQLVFWNTVIFWNTVNMRFLGYRIVSSVHKTTISQWQKICHLKPAAFHVAYDVNGKSAQRNWGVVRYLCKSSEAQDEGFLTRGRLLNCSIFQSTLKPPTRKQFI